MNPFQSQLGNQSMMSQDVKRTVIRSAITGAALAAAGTFIYGNGNISVVSMQVPAAVPLFVAGAAGSAIADYTHNEVARNLPLGLGDKLGDISSSAVGVGICGVSAAAIMKFGAGLPNENLLQAAGLGAVSYLVAAKAEETFLETQGQLIF